MAGFGDFGGILQTRVFMVDLGRKWQIGESA